MKSVTAFPVLGVSLLLLACTTPVSVTGPCDVASDSTVTFDVAWMVSAAVDPGSDTAASSAAAAPRAEAENESMLLMIDAPAAWTLQTATWEGTINGSAASGSAELLGAAPYCADSFVPLRSGYTRQFFRIAPGVVMDDASGGTLHATYDTGTTAEGVYHLLVMGVPEEVCFAGAAFHRVTSGSPVFVPFNIAPALNADVVLNGSDATQDPLLETTDDSYVFLTQSAAFGSTAASALPDDGVLSTDALAALIGTSPVPFDAPECLPSFQSAVSEGDDGNNVWLADDLDDMATINVPARQYAEVMLLVSGAVTPSTSDALPTSSRMRVTFRYADDSTSSDEVTVYGAGYRYLFPPVPDEPLVPSMSVVASAAVALPYDPSAETGAGTIDAIMLSPDSSKVLSSITIQRIPSADPDPVLGEQNLALFAAGGMAIAAPATSDIPTLSELAMLALAGVLGLMAVRVLRP
jgi:hypothetical protein